MGFTTSAGSTFVLLATTFFATCSSLKSGDVHFRQPDFLHRNLVLGGSAQSTTAFCPNASPTRNIFTGCLSECDTLHYLPLISFAQGWILRVQSHPRSQQLPPSQQKLENQGWMSRLLPEKLSISPTVGIAVWPSKNILGIHGPRWSSVRN